MITLEKLRELKAAMKAADAAYSKSALAESHASDTRRKAQDDCDHARRAYETALGQI